MDENADRKLATAKPAAQRKPFRVNARSMGLRPEIDLSNIEQLVDELDGPERR